MDGLIVARTAGILEARPFQHSPQVFKRDSAVDLHQGPLDDVLKLGRVDGTRAAEAEQVSPGLGGEPSSFVGSHDPKCHRQGQTVIHSRNLGLYHESGKHG